MRNLITENGEYKLFAPLNTQDTNYHLIEAGKVDYLIDIADLAEEGITREELIKLEDVGTLKELAWKTVEVDKEVF